MKDQIGTEDCGNQVYVITIDNAAKGQCLRDFLEQQDYTFFTACEESESFRDIQDAISAPQNDSAAGFREESPSMIEAVAPQELPLSRSDFHGHYDDILGESGVHLEVLEHIEMFAKSSQTVLISGETGTGKELVATALHAQSARVVNAMVVVNCAGIAEHLIESEFFGHEEGAFTGADRQHIGLFETASGGTLFLDEIGELPMSLQSNLLRVLQENKIRRVGGTEQIPVDVRVIAATNADLAEAVEAGRFRRDLYERLKPLHILLPALRERRGDIPALAIHFLAKALTDYTQKIEDINPEILSLFHDYAWPGNIRELEGVIGRAVLLAKGCLILPRHLPQTVRKSHAPPLDLASEGSTDLVRSMLPFPIGTTLKEIEKSAILTTLAREDGNQSKTAAVLGISRPTLRAKLHAYNGSGLLSKRAYS